MLVFPGAASKEPRGQPATRAPHSAMDKAAAQTFLQGLLNRKLRVHTTDERMFWGEFKCTDPVSPRSAPGLCPNLLSPTESESLTKPRCSQLSQDRNIVLQYTYEYRQPSTAQRTKAAAAAGADAASFKMDLLHRYLGLVVVPGEHIVKIEKEDFASQMKK